MFPMLLLTQTSLYGYRNQSTKRYVYLDAKPSRQVYKKRSHLPNFTGIAVGIWNDGTFFCTQEYVIVPDSERDVSVESISQRGVLYNGMILVWNKFIFKWSTST